MEKQKGSGHWFKLWNQVRKTPWGLVIDTRGSASGFIRTNHWRERDGSTTVWHR